MNMYCYLKIEEVVCSNFHNAEENQADAEDDDDLDDWGVGFILLPSCPDQTFQEDVPHVNLVG